MNEPQVHEIPGEVSGAIKRLEQAQTHVSKMGASAAEFLALVQGLDTTFRLLCDRARAGLADEQPDQTEAGETEPTADEPSEAPGPYGQESWFEPLWRGVVALVNAQIAAAGRPGQAAPAISPSAVQVLTRFRADRLQPLRELVGALRRWLRDAGADPDLKPAADRYQALWQAVERLTGQVAEWEREQGPEQLWAGELTTVSLQPDSLIRMIERDGRQIPQIDFSALREIEAEANRQIAERCAVAVPDDEQPASPAPDRFGKLDSEFLELLEKLVDLKHSLAEAQARKEQFGQSTDRIRDPLKLLQTKLHELEVDEIEIRRGDRVNGRLHTVVSREADTRLGAGEITRVLVAGYRYRGEVKRMAQVVATP